jgi:hypothetical protein
MINLEYTFCLLLNVDMQKLRLLFRQRTAITLSWANEMHLLRLFTLTLQ